MPDDKRLPVAPPGTAVSRTPMGDVPTTLPSSSGAWFGSRTYITKKDAEFVEAHARLLKARADQCEALGTLLDKRTELAAKIADLHNVLAEHQRVRQRASESTGTSLVVVVGCECRPCSSNFCPVAMPPM